MKSEFPEDDLDGGNPPPQLIGGKIEDFLNVKHPDTAQSVDFEQFLHRLTDLQNGGCVRFESAEGGHFVRHEDNGDLTAVYAGPHGAENRPAGIDRENLERLFEMSERIDFVPEAKSPFSDLVIRTSSHNRNS